MKYLTSSLKISPYQKPDTSASKFSKMFWISRIVCECSKKRRNEPWRSSVRQRKKLRNFRKLLSKMIWRLRARSKCNHRGKIVSTRPNYKCLNWKWEHNLRPKCVKPKFFIKNKRMHKPSKCRRKSNVFKKSNLMWSIKWPRTFKSKELMKPTVTDSRFKHNFLLKKSRLPALIDPLSKRK